MGTTEFVVGTIGDVGQPNSDTFSTDTFSVILFPLVVTAHARSNIYRDFTVCIIRCVYRAELIVGR